MFKVPEQFRVKTHPILATDSSFGNNGFFIIPMDEGTANVIASDGLGWEHVSVHIVIENEPALPTWEEMCMIKDLFWDDSDTVIQFHPPKSEYVNQHEHTLHLWRPTTVDFPRPSTILVGKLKR